MTANATGSVGSMPTTHCVEGETAKKEKWLPLKSQLSSSDSEMHLSSLPCPTTLPLEFDESKNSLNSVFETFSIQLNAQSETAELSTGMCNEDRSRLATAKGPTTFGTGGGGCGENFSSHFPHLCSQSALTVFVYEALTEFIRRVVHDNVTFRRLSQQTRSLKIELELRLQHITTSFNKNQRKKVRSEFNELTKIFDEALARLSDHFESHTSFGCSCVLDFLLPVSHFQRLIEDEFPEIISAMIESRNAESLNSSNSNYSSTEEHMMFDEEANADDCDPNSLFGDGPGEWT